MSERRRDRPYHDLKRDGYSRYDERSRGFTGGRFSRSSERRPVEQRRSAVESRRTREPSSAESSMLLLRDMRLEEFNEVKPFFEGLVVFLCFPKGRDLCIDFGDALDAQNAFRRVDGKELSFRRIIKADILKRSDLASPLPDEPSDKLSLDVLTRFGHLHEIRKMKEAVSSQSTETSEFLYEWTSAVHSFHTKSAERMHLFHERRNDGISWSILKSHIEELFQ